VQISLSLSLHGRRIMIFLASAVTLAFLNKGVRLPLLLLMDNIGGNRNMHWSKDDEKKVLFFQSSLSARAGDRSHGGSGPGG
jgi:hypothetical protein